MKDTDKQQGFMLYAEDWEEWTADYSSEEVGEMLKAVLAYFKTGETAIFSDRGMRQFYRQATKSIDLDRKRYSEKCLQNAFNRYKGTCKKSKTEPLDFEEWATTVNDRQEPSTTVNDQITKADENDQQQQQLSTATPTATDNSNGNRGEGGETTTDTISQALNDGKISLDEAVALRLLRR